MSDYKEIGKRLKQFALSDFETLTKFSEAMGMTLPGLYPYFNGKSLPGTIFLLKIKKLGCSIDWLLTGEKNLMEMKLEQLKKIIEG